MKKQLAVFLTILLVASAFAPMASASPVAQDDADDQIGAAGSVDSAATTAADAQCEYPAEYTDATGEEITLEEAPDSVVALQPSDAQTMFEIGAEDRLDGMPDTPATEELDMGEREAVMDEDYTVLDEQIVALDPDIVLAANATFDDDVEQLREAGLDVYVFDEGNSLDNVRENTLTTGELVGECDGAENSVEWMDERIDLLENATAEDADDRPLAFYDMRAGETAGTNSFQHEVLTTAGVENLAERVGLETWGAVDSEQIVDEDPEWVIHPDDGMDEYEFSAGVDETTAYEEDNILPVDDNAMSQPAPQVVFAIEEIVEGVYPDAYAEIEADLEALDEEHRDDESGDADDGTADDETIPGFGVPAAAAALLAASLFLLRQR